MNFEELPLKVQEDCINLVSEVKAWKADVGDIIKTVKITGNYIELKDVARDFYFIISEPMYDRVRNVTTFKITCCPGHELNYEVVVLRAEVKGVYASFSKWLDRLKRLNVALKKHQELLKEANEAEVYIPFEEVEDFDKHLTPEKQQKIETALILLQTSLEENQNKYPVGDILETVVGMRRNLATLPERVIMEMGQSVMKKIGDLGKEAVNDILKDGLKDFIKYLFLNEAARQLLTHLHLLQ